MNHESVPVIADTQTTPEGKSAERKLRIRDFDKNSTLAHFHHFKAKRTVVCTIYRLMARLKVGTLVE